MHSGPYYRVPDTSSGFDHTVLTHYRNFVDVRTGRDVRLGHMGYIKSADLSIEKVMMGRQVAFRRSDVQPVVVFHDIGIKRKRAGKNIRKDIVLK